MQAATTISQQNEAMIRKSAFNLPKAYDQEFIDPVKYQNAIIKLRNFFVGEKKFIEIPAQSQISILAACEDPTTIQTYTFANEVWPLPQTGQMWLEHALLTKPDVPGYFCITTSYRMEANPIPGRHKMVFPMFEFESHGGFDDLLNMEKDLVEYLGIAPRDKIAEGDYLDVAKEFGVEEIDAKCEGEMYKKYGNAFLLKKFPVKTSPFWNMRMNSDGTAKKIDVILCGHETIGSAERAVDKEEMHRLFHNISDGVYAKLLYQTFGEARVEAELEDYLSLTFFERFGGGIGVTRMMNAMDLAKA